MKITLCMIVKNEEKYIKACLENALKLADNAVIVDTGSTDRTIELLKEFGSKIEIKYYTWNNNFSEARNYSIEKIESDWILVLDADERLVCHIEKVRRELLDSDMEGYNIAAFENSDNGSQLKSRIYARLFKNNGYTYHRAIHEQLNIDMNKVKDMDENICSIFHYGYSSEVIEEKEKFKRNLQILLNEAEKLPEDPFICYHLGATYGAMQEYNLSLHYYKKCLELSKKNGFANYHFTLFKKMALTFYELGKYSDCIDFIDSILKDKSMLTYVDLFFIKALCLKKLSEYTKAEKVFKHCLEIGDNDDFPTLLGRGSFLARLELANIYKILGNVNLAVSTYVEAVLAPNNRSHQGFKEFRNYLHEEKLFDIENELIRLVSGNK